MTGKASQLVAEIKHRRLPQTAALYIAVAWGGTEILVFLIESLLDETIAKEARRLLAIMLIAGFPAVLYLAWVRDLGLKARRLIGAGVMVIVIGAVLVSIVEPPAPPLGDRSIAVLPFDVCDERSSDRTLALGLTAAVHGRLAERQGISVVGRPTMTTVLDTSPSLTTVARLLGVNYLLSGILCRDGRAPVLQAELLDDHGKVIWRQEFRETTNEYDQVGKQLAELVDNSVASRFGDRSAGISGPAINQEALRQLQIGYGFLEQDEPEKAGEAFEKALDIEPDYPGALYALSLTVAGHLGGGNRKSTLEQTAQILTKALARAKADVKFNPRDFEANKIAGFITHNLAEDENEIAYTDLLRIGDAAVLERKKRAQAKFVEAQRYLDTALAIRPDDSQVRVWAAHNLAFQSPAHRREAMELLKAGLEMDPFNVMLARNLASRLVEFGDVNGAMDLIDSFSVLPQGKRDLWWSQLEILNNLGRIDDKLAYHIELLREAPAGDGNPIFGHLAWNAAHLAYIGLHDEAAALYETLAKTPFDKDNWYRQYFLHDMYNIAIGQGEEYAERESQEVADMSNEEILESWYLNAANHAWVFWDTGDRERAIEIMEALAYYPQQTAWKEREMDFSFQLAHMYDAVGKMASKKSVLDRVVVYLEEEVAAGVRHPKTLEQLAEAYAGLGKSDAALETLDLAIDYGFADPLLCCRDYLSDAQKGALLFDDTNNWWGEFTGDPDFELARTRMRSIIDAQRANIRALLAANDIGDLLAPWAEFYERELAVSN